MAQKGESKGESKEEGERGKVYARAWECLERVIKTPHADRHQKLKELLSEPLDVRREITNFESDTKKVPKEVMIEVLSYLLKNDADDCIRSSAASSLGYQGDHDSVRAPLVAALKDPASNVRLFACQSLMWSKDKSVGASVAELLNDKSQEVRHVAVRTLGWLGNPKYVEPIVALHKTDGGKPDRDHVFGDALARLGEKELSLKCFQSAMCSSNWNVRHFAVEAVAFIDSDKVTPILIESLTPELTRTIQEMQINVGDRVFTGLCKELERRTGQQFGTDVFKWHVWWAKNKDAR